MTRPSNRTSFIKGVAEVHFGGAIAVEAGRLKDGRIAIAFSEAKEQKKVGEKIEERWEPQVFLIFDNLGSIKIVRDALDYVEEEFKYGEHGDKEKP